MAITLPPPGTATEIYLFSVLEELKALNKNINALEGTLTAPSKSEPKQEPESEIVVDIKEPSAAPKPASKTTAKRSAATTKARSRSTKAKK